MEKEYEVITTVEVTISTMARGRSPEDAVATAEDLVEEAVEGLSPGGPCVMLDQVVIASDAAEYRGESSKYDEEEED